MAKIEKHGLNDIIQVGTRIKQLRKERGYKEKDFAEAIGIPYTTYSNYENNKRTPNKAQLEKIAAALGVTVFDLLGISQLEGKELKMINKDTDMDALKQIADHYGLHTQLHKLYEEASELNRAASRYSAGMVHDYSDFEKRLDNLIEEMADVDIMIHQIIYLLNAENETNIVTKYKLDRQLARMKSESEGEEDE